MKRSLAAVAAAVAVVWACSSEDRGPAGGAVAGPADTRCRAADGGAIVQTTSQASCHGGPPDGGVVDYGQTLFNAEGDDDDCKYHLKFTSTPIYQNTDVSFTLTLTNKADGGPAAGAAASTEMFLSETHPAPNTNRKTTETPPGTYKIGPVRFDQKGRWTVRFHVYEECDEGLPDSPHGHGAFFVDVP
jgi:hypothetical protein